MLTDLSTYRLEKIANRITRLLDRYATISEFGAQYRLGEVGRDRIHPKELRRALSELTNNQRPRRGRVQAGPKQVIEGILVSPDLSEKAARDQSGETLQALESMCALPWLDSSDLIAENALAAMEPEFSVISAYTSPRAIGEVGFDASDRLFRAAWGNGQETILWISHDVNWIYPEDFRLWRAFQESRSQRLPLLIVARAVAPPTFVLLRALGAQATQYYSTIIANEWSKSALVAAENCGWLHLRPALSLQQHPITGHITAALLRLASQTPSEAAGDAIDAATAAGWSNTPFRLRGLIDWATDVSTELDLPDKWLDTLRDWAAWDSFVMKRTSSKKDGRSIRAGEVTRIGIRIR